MHGEICGGRRHRKIRNYLIDETNRKKKKRKEKAKLQREQLKVLARRLTKQREKNRKDERVIGPKSNTFPTVDGWKIDRVEVRLDRLTIKDYTDITH